MLRAALGLVAGALAVAAYLNALSNPFVYADYDRVLLNPSLFEGSGLRAVLAFDRFHPVLNLSYAIDRLFWGFSSFGYHVTSVALHAAVVLLFYGLCTRLFADVAPEAGSAAEWPAFAAAAVYAVHPALSQAVDYVSARSELLCAAGIIAAVIFARSAIVRGRATAAAGSVVAAAIALGSSESAIALPFVLLACDAWVFGRDTWRRRVTRVYLPAVIVVAAYGALRIAFSDGTWRAFVSPLLTGGLALGRYALLLLVPRGQTIMHPAQISAAADLSGWLALALAIGALVLAWRVRGAEPLVTIGVIWFVAALVPAIVSPSDWVAEHRLYVPAAGLLLAAAAALRGWLSRTVAARAVLLALIAACCWGTVRRNRVWQQEVSLWSEAARQPGATWRAHAAYGDALRAVGDCQAAIAEYETALRLDAPAEPIARAVDGCR